MTAGGNINFGPTSEQLKEAFTAPLRNLAEVWRPIPVTHKLKIDKFIEYYLGTKNKPVPFGGRKKEIEALSQWLSDQTAPRTFL